MRQRAYTISINGDRWRYRVLSDERFKLIHADMPDAAAVTMSSEKRMDFTNEALTVGHIVHELNHAYISYLYVESTDMRVSDFEEMVCMLQQNKAEQILEQARKMLGKLKGVSVCQE